MHSHISNPPQEKRNKEAAPYQWAQSHTFQTIYPVPTPKAEPEKESE